MRGWDLAIPRGLLLDVARDSGPAGLGLPGPDFTLCAQRSHGASGWRQGLGPSPGAPLPQRGGKLAPVGSVSASITHHQEGRQRGGGGGAGALRARRGRGGPRCDVSGSPRPRKPLQQTRISRWGKDRGGLWPPSSPSDDEGHGSGHRPRAPAPPSPVHTHPALVPEPPDSCLVFPGGERSPGPHSLCCQSPATS